MKKIAILLTILIVNIYAQSCSVIRTKRIDCGFRGMTQKQCEDKKCCWKQSKIAKAHCFYPRGENPCAEIKWNGSQGQGFDKEFFEKMYELLDKNIDIQGKGGITVCSNQQSSYYGDWVRDSALAMRSYIEINNFNLSAIQTKIQSYLGWVQRCHAQDSSNHDIRIVPKFSLPDGYPDDAGVCIPQTDGPALRSSTLQLYADLLLKNGQKVPQTLVQPIKFDLEWILQNWDATGFDTQCYYKSNDLFWNKMVFVYTLAQCENLFKTLGDADFAGRCSSTRNTIKATIDAHWTGDFMMESDKMKQSSAVIMAFSSFTGIYPLTDAKIAKTVKAFAKAFCLEYPLNKDESREGMPGVLFGRFPGDHYNGGNIWHYYSAYLAKIFYQAAIAMAQSNGFLNKVDQYSWSDLLKLPKEATSQDFIKAAIAAGDSVMYRLYEQVKNDNGHMTQQIDRLSGKQTFVDDYTWSYASILNSMKDRETALLNLETMQKITIQ